MKELSDNEKAFAKEMIKNISFDVIKKNKEYINSYINVNLTRERIENLDKNKVLNFDALYHFRTNWMARLKMFEVTGDPNYSSIIGNRPSLPIWSLNSTICFNEAISCIEIDNELWTHLFDSTNEIFERKMPYNYMFINKIFELYEGILCFGIGAAYSEDPKNKEKFANSFTLQGYDYNDNTDWRMSFNIKDGKLDFDAEELFKDIKTKEIAEKIANIFSNIVDFFNHPEVDIRVIKWPNNTKRISKGKFPIPDSIRITVRGKLHHYIYEEFPQQKEEQRKSPNYSYIVRGHYMHFWDKGRWKRLYAMDETALKSKGYQIDDKKTISKWKPQFIKGKGILRTKKKWLTK